MKVCVYFKPNKKKDNFEGARLRENIKGALKENSIEVTTNIKDDYDLIHFISNNDLSKIKEAKRRNIPVVVSALSCESDDGAKFLEGKSGLYSLSPKGKNALNSVDVVIVGDNASKELLSQLNVKTNIEVISPGVDLSRFELDEENKNIFYQYFQVDKRKKIACVIGTYEDKTTPLTLAEIAINCPNYVFFYFGDSNTLRIIHQNNKMPSNVRLCQITNNEIYCSMMDNASIYLSLDNKNHSPVTILDAIASKTQIVALEPTYLNKEILENAHAYVGKETKEVASILCSLEKKELKDTTSEAYKYAQKCSLKNIGQQLSLIYQNILNRR